VLRAARRRLRQEALALHKTNATSGLEGAAAAAALLRAAGASDNDDDNELLLDGSDANDTEDVYSSYKQHHTEPFGKSAHELPQLLQYVSCSTCVHLDTVRQHCTLVLCSSATRPLLIVLQATA
jgi:hypothetical protein